jgi:hypothetical protein
MSVVNLFSAGNGMEAAEPVLPLGLTHQPVRDRLTAKEAFAMHTMPRFSPRALVRRLISMWDALQVELHGQYSREHLRMLCEYVSTKHSVARLAALLIATPLPSLALLLLFDSLPLAPPELGANENIGFWIRSAVVSILLSTGSVVHMNALCPQLEISRPQVVVCVLVSTISVKLFGYALSLVIGFPVPFSLVLESPMGIFVIAATTAPNFLRLVRSSPTSKLSLRDFNNTFSLNGLQLFIYPLCNFLFARAPPSLQPLVALLLGIVKIAFKNGFNRCMREHPELRGVLVNFHGEIFSSLFVTFSMQSASSFTTVAVLTLGDFLHACSILYEAHCSLQALEALERTFGSDGRFGHASLNVIDRLNAIIEQQETSVPSRSRSSGASSAPNRPWIGCLWNTSRNKVTELRTRTLSNRPAPLFVGVTNAVSKIHPASPVSGHTSETTSKGPVDGNTCEYPETAEQDARRSVTTPTATAVEDVFVAKALALLHLTEFAVLTEFVEIIVPVVYGEAPGWTLTIVHHARLTQLILSRYLRVRDLSAAEPSLLP